MLIGRKTYEMLNGLPAEVRDEGWDRTTRNPGWLFSHILDATDWPGLEIVHDDLRDTAVQRLVANTHCDSPNARAQVWGQVDWYTRSQIVQILRSKALLSKK